MYQYPNYLMRHGVKGMKWGVRRAKRTYQIKRNAKAYSKSVNEFKKMSTVAKKQNLAPGTIVSSKTGTKIKVTDAGAEWLSGNKKVQQMSIDDIMDAMYYNTYKKIPD